MRRKFLSIWLECIRYICEHIKKSILQCTKIATSTRACTTRLWPSLITNIRCASSYCRVHARWMINMLLLRLRRIYYSYCYYHNAMSTGLRSKDAMFDSFGSAPEPSNRRTIAICDQQRDEQLFYASRGFFHRNIPTALIQKLRVLLYIINSATYYTWNYVINPAVSRAQSTFITEIIIIGAVLMPHNARVYKET